jgi:hypothetical protein
MDTFANSTTYGIPSGVTLTSLLEGIVGWGGGLGRGRATSGSYAIKLKIGVVEANERLLFDKYEAVR